MYVDLGSLPSPGVWYGCKAGGHGNESALMLTGLGLSKLLLRFELTFWRFQPFCRTFTIIIRPFHSQRSETKQTAKVRLFGHNNFSHLEL